MSEFALGESVFGTDALSVQKLFNVEGWVAVVTGGGTGLGLVTAAALAENGCKVYISGRRLDVLEKAAKAASPKNGKGQIIPVQGDVGTKEGIIKLREAVEKNEKWLNILVNNAGVSEPHGEIDDCEQTPEGVSKEMFEKESFETWANTHRINTASYHFTTFAFLPLLCAAKSKGGFREAGNVINVASLSGITRTSQHGQFNYNSGKAATRHLSLMLSTDFARRGFGVRVNCINPGYFPSGMSVKDVPKDDPEAAANLFKTKYAIPFGIVGTAKDYAQTIFGIVTNEYMTGCDIVIDGGWLATQSRCLALFFRRSG
ncbi:hypothetical protein BD324DRAFT_643603 [Kockovaella imperatae]|uniref:NAD(P)-binding protein n=1 Tax=Kockovaella imperatae TaxID=4999 RepID=A0A1Y1U9T2_9TREE|nr:hypothetical protein BD324DRAFT_643603 [Kockovaella imperatae]ORX34304.1 hypothetical protein BD324DRAFT_643603 [Kockovaella imperatae]